MEQDVNPNPLPPPPGPPGPEGEGAVVIPLVADPSLNDPRLPHPQQQQQCTMKVNCTERQHQHQPRQQ